MVRWKSFGGKKPSLKAQVFIRDRISQLMREGYPHKQAVAIAHSEARKKGFKIRHYEPTEHEKEYYYKYGGS